MSSSDRTLIAAFKEISQMADLINLTKSIVDRANKLFKQVQDGNNLRGRSNDAKATACLYIACRQEGVPRTFKEICAISKISKKQIGRCFKLTLKALATSVDAIKTDDFMSRFCAVLGMLTTPNSYTEYFFVGIIVIISHIPNAVRIHFTYHYFLFFCYCLQACRQRFNVLPPMWQTKRTKWTLYRVVHRFQWQLPPSTSHHRHRNTSVALRKLVKLLV